MYLLLLLKAEGKIIKNHEDNERDSIYLSQRLNIPSKSNMTGDILKVLTFQNTKKAE